MSIDPMQDELDYVIPDKDCRPLDTDKDTSFICSKCGSEDIKHPPIFSPYLVCRKCGHTWAKY